MRSRAGNVVKLLYFAATSIRGWMALSSSLSVYAARTIARTVASSIPENAAMRLTVWS